MSLVNGIPTSQEFRKRLGRTGVSKIFKMGDPEIENILRALHDAEVWRHQENDAAVEALRKVRRACIKWLETNPANQKKRAARPRITNLLTAVHNRITIISEKMYAHKSSSARDNWNFLLSMHNLTDEKGKKLPKRNIGRKLGPDYLLERTTKSHYVGHNLDTVKMRWKIEVRNNNTKMDLDDWVTHIWIPQEEDDPWGTFVRYSTCVSGKTHRQVSNPVTIQQLKNQQVKYCDAKERKDYIITLRGGSFREVTGGLYHTGTKSTVFSGSGWAIYVIDYANNFYSASHRLGEFHHSSFLSGAPVKAAGEIAVKNGKVTAITNKTGHYRAGSSELACALKLLHRGGTNLNKVLVSNLSVKGGRGTWLNGQDMINADCDVDKILRKGVKKSAPPERII